jgi:hypothetical protein
MEQESQVLKQIKELFQQQGVAPEHVAEVFCPKDKFDTVKTQIRQKYGGKCSFFTKEKDNEIHIIVLINIQGLEKFAKEFKEASGYDYRESLDKTSFNTLKSSIYSPVVKFVGMNGFGEALNKAKNDSSKGNSVNAESKVKFQAIKRVEKKK